VIWLLAFTSALWMLSLQQHHPLWDRSALLLSASGTLLMAATPLLGESNPVMNNYIPVLVNPPFLIGLSLFATGLTIVALRLIIETSSDKQPKELPRQLLQAAATTSIAALVVIAIAALRLPELSHAAYFEQLFWGGGHILQFVHILTLIYAWYWLNGSSVMLTTPGPIYRLLLLPALVGLLIALMLDPLDTGYRHAFTQLMRWGSLLILLPASLWALNYHFKYRPQNSTPRLASILLLLLGLIIGLLIRNDTVIVTAHYHATNAAVTLAFMALSYQLLPLIGLVTPGTKSIRLQARIYALGMALYISGMAWSGWLGIPRKSADTLHDSFGTAAHYAMGLMGTGGLIAIIATMLFLGIIITSHYTHKRASQMHSGTGNAQ